MYFGELGGLGFELIFADFEGLDYCLEEEPLEF